MQPNSIYFGPKSSGAKYILFGYINPWDYNEGTVRD